MTPQRIEQEVLALYQSFHALEDAFPIPEHFSAGEWWRVRNARVDRSREEIDALRGELEQVYATQVAAELERKAYRTLDQMVGLARTRIARTSGAFPVVHVVEVSRG